MNLGYGAGISTAPSTRPSLAQALRGSHEVLGAMDAAFNILEETLFGPEPRATDAGRPAGPLSLEASSEDLLRKLSDQHQRLQRVLDRVGVRSANPADGR